MFTSINAPTGIAANLLHLGRTFHSRFKLPLNINSESVCNIDARSTLAKLICETRIIVWDEAPMSHRFQLEALDRTLRDITDKDAPFGGKIMLLSGDFRQCLPVIPGASRAEVVDAALNRSYLWQYFKVMKLSENMRVKMSGDPNAVLAQTRLSYLMTCV
jgi:ATP-dependent DNA helicase PIF1